MGELGGVGRRWRRPTSEDLVEEHLDVVGGERLRRHDDLVEVALHQLCDDVSTRQSRYTLLHTTRSQGTHYSKLRDESAWSVCRAVERGQRADRER